MGLRGQWLGLRGHGWGLGGQGLAWMGTCLGLDWRAAQPIVVYRSIVGSSLSYSTRASSAPVECRESSSRIVEHQKSSRVVSRATQASLVMTLQARRGKNYFCLPARRGERSLFGTFSFDDSLGAAREEVVCRRSFGVAPLAVTQGGGEPRESLASRIFVTSSGAIRRLPTSSSAATM